MTFVPADGPEMSTVLRAWGRIGCLGFGGPPTHIRMLRERCVDREEWISPTEFEDAVAVCNLLPGPASTQLAIYCAWRLRGAAGAIVGGLAFILPGLVLTLALAALFLGNPPEWVRGAGAGAGAAVAAVAVHAGWGLTPTSWARRSSTLRWLAYLVVGAVCAATTGPWVVVALIACGLVELSIRRPSQHLALLPLMLTGAGSASLAWTALKVGALSYGGGFVIIPLMRSDAVGHHWMTEAEFLNAIVLGQITPGPVVHTVAVVGYAASGLLGGILAAAIAFAPSFVFVLAGGRYFDRLRGDGRARAFLDGAGPAAIGAIYGSAVPLAGALTDAWQYVVLAMAVVALFGLRRGVVVTLLLAAVVGVVVTLS